MKTSLLASARFVTIGLACSLGFGQALAGDVQDGSGTGGVVPAPGNISAVDPVIKAGEKVTLKGKLKGGMMGIGGETTGWNLTYGEATIEVDMSAIKDAESFDGKNVTVSGSIVSKEYVERGAVLILKAEKMEPAP